MQTVAVGWQVYAATSDPLDLGLIGLSQFLPFILLILPAGHVADHYDRRKILAVCYFLSMTSSVGLLAFSLLGIHEVGWVFAVMALFGVTRAFAMPSAQALIPNLVPPELFARATAVNSPCFKSAPSPVRHWVASSTSPVRASYSAQWRRCSLLRRS